MKSWTAILTVMTVLSFDAMGVERISVDEVLNHYPWDGKVDCVCTLSGLEEGYVYKGSFTLSVKKAGTTARQVITKNFTSGNGVYTNTFDCAELFGAGIYPNGAITIDLVKTENMSDATGEPIGVVGDVFIIDVSGGCLASSFPTKSLSDVDIGTFNCDAYKTDKIVLRRVPAGSHYCQPRGVYDYAHGDVTQKLVVAKDFYIGVFPVTQRQYELVMGMSPSYFSTNIVCGEVGRLPVESVSWDAIRGGLKADEAITTSSPRSFLQQLVLKTGQSGYDLPTEAQWEVSCRADVAASFGAYWDGTASVEIDIENEDSLRNVVSFEGDSSYYLLHEVGAKKPNLWGLYDMQGGVFEWCRDLFVTAYNIDYVDHPCTERSYEGGSCRVCRGFSYGVAIECIQPSYHAQYYRADLSKNTIGFRLFKNCP